MINKHFNKRADDRGVWPRLTHKEIYTAGWNDALEVLEDILWTRRDQREDRGFYSEAEELSLISKIT
jgi:hypothetical protein